MKDKESIPADSVWHERVLHLGQALLGTVTSNFRKVELQYDRGKWILFFVLERDDSSDREEIADLALEWVGLHTHPLEFEVDIIVSNERMKRTAGPHWTVFLRKEAECEDEPGCDAP